MLRQHHVQCSAQPDRESSITGSDRTKLQEIGNPKSESFRAGNSRCRQKSVWSLVFITFSGKTLPDSVFYLTKNIQWRKTGGKSSPVRHQLVETHRKNKNGKLFSFSLQPHQKRPKNSKGVKYKIYKNKQDTGHLLLLSFYTPLSFQLFRNQIFFGTRVAEVNRPRMHFRFCLLILRLLISSHSQPVHRCGMKLHLWVSKGESCFIRT